MCRTTGILTQYIYTVGQFGKECMEGIYDDFYTPTPSPLLRSRNPCPSHINPIHGGLLMTSIMAGGVFFYPKSMTLFGGFKIGFMPRFFEHP